MTYYSDGDRHLVCMPYSVDNLHEMARQLGIRRCWFHAGRWPHYDIPKLRIAEIGAKTVKVSGKSILRICKGLTP